MKRIHKLVLISYLGPFIMTFFISLFILLMQFLWKYIDDLVGKGLEWYIIGELLFYASATFVPLALPLAILLSSLMTFGNLGEHYELVAMKSAGISLRRIMKPLAFLSVGISIFAFFFSNNMLPVVNLKFKSLLYDVRKKKMAVNIKEGVFFNDLEDYVIKVGSKGKDGKKIYNVLIYNHTKKRGNINVTVADSGLMDPAPDGRYLKFTLYSGYNYEENIDQKGYQAKRPQSRTYFKEQSKVFDLSTFELNRSKEDLFKNNYEMLNITQLNLTIDSLGTSLADKRNNFSGNYLNNYTFYSTLDSVRDVSDSSKITGELLASFDRKEQLMIIENALTTARNLKKSVGYYNADFEERAEYIRKHKVVWHKKLTLSFACLILFFIGAPLGAIIRRGGLGLPVVVSVIFFILYHIISMIGEKSAKGDVINIAAGMWLSSAIILPLGIYLTYKATVDAPIMDREIWNKLFDKVDFIKKLIKKYRK